MNKLKKLILGGVLAGAGFVSGFYTSRATKGLDDFLRNVPGVAQVNECNSDSKNYFIIIRQRHNLPELENPETKEENIPLLEATNRVQGNIYRILGNLRESLGIGDVYVEGFTQPLSRWELEDHIKRTPFREYPYLRGGAIRLGAEGKIRIRPAELLENYNKMDFAKRERTAVELIGRDNPRIAVLVYGANHKFKDDVERWNRENPNKYNLIEVTPKGLD